MGARALLEAGREPEGLAYEDTDTGLKIVAQRSACDVRIIDDEKLDAAILELQTKAPDAFKTFVARAVLKETFSYSAQNAERRVGAMDVVCKVHLLVQGVKERVEARRAAQRKAAAARKPKSP